MVRKNDFSKHLALDEDDPPSHDSTDENDEAELGSGSSCRKLNGWFVQRRSSDPCWKCYIPFEQLSRRHMWIPSGIRWLPNTLLLHVREAPIDYLVLSFFRSGDPKKMPHFRTCLRTCILGLRYCRIHVSAIPRVHAHASQVSRRILKALSAFHKRVSSYRHPLYGTQSTSHSSQPSFRACLR